MLQPIERPPASCGAAVGGLHEPGPAAGDHGEAGLGEHPAEPRGRRYIVVIVSPNRAEPKTATAAPTSARALIPWTNSPWIRRTRQGSVWVNAAQLRPAWARARPARPVEELLVLGRSVGRARRGCVPGLRRGSIGGPTGPVVLDRLDWISPRIAFVPGFRGRSCRDPSRSSRSIVIHSRDDRRAGGVGPSPVELHASDSGAMRPVSIIRPRSEPRPTDYRPASPDRLPLNSTGRVRPANRAPGLVGAMGSRDVTSG